MNVFILSTGRCGSMTITKACSHITNFTSGHETNIAKSKGRLDYPDHHIESDNRLSWMLGSLHRNYPYALYVHLTRDPARVAYSYSKRFNVKSSIMVGFSTRILQRKLPKTEKERFALSSHYTRVVRDNIKEFIKDKPHINIPIEDPIPGFAKLWDIIGAEGNWSNASSELKIKYNSR